jgi:alpha-glucosidase
MENRTNKTVLLLWVNLFCFTAVVANGQKQKTYKILSPDQKIECAVTIGQNIKYAVSLEGHSILDPSLISMTLNENRVLGENPQVTGVHRRTVRQEIRPDVPVKSAIITDHCNELTLSFKGYSVIFRTYDNGVAYCFRTDLKGELTVVSETAEFNFSGTQEVFFPAEDSFFSHNERTYLHTSLDSLPAGRLASLPVLVGTEGPKVLIEESALRDYPGMWVKAGGGNILTAVFPHYPLESRLRGNSDRDVPVIRAADFIAKTKANRSFPWRILAIATHDGDLITNQLVYQLADNCEIRNPSWIKPGKVAWDWWNANNLYGVEFRAGINTETYKYYIDFASEFGIEYIILDEGWYKLGDLLDVVPDMDVKALVDYGKQKNVGVILWVVWKTLDDQLETALDQFEKWGAAGIKVDFMQRDDQEMVNYYWKIAAAAAERQMLVDFHGAYKPAGLRRAFPNVITREGVKGSEHNKWSRDITPTHNLTLPFIRMVPGPMDYTPGAMINAQPRNFRDIFTRPMSMGTRAHQVAMYIIYESPLQMMEDSPSNYLKERECTQFISEIPTTWDETRVFEAAVGEYLVLARKNGDRWYVGGMTNETARTFTIDLSFLEEGKFTAEFIEDGINADRFGSDYRKLDQSVSRADTLKITLAPGGGWAGIFRPENSDP